MGGQAAGANLAPGSGASEPGCRHFSPTPGVVRGYTSFSRLIVARESPAMPVTLGAMNLLDLLSPECIRAPLVATDKRGVIDELVDLLVAAGRVSEGDSLKNAVWSREQTRTTGIGHGLAIPHGKCPGLNGLAMAIGKPAEPLEFQAIDGRPVRLIVLLASPPDRTGDHIQRWPG